MDTIGIMIEEKINKITRDQRSCIIDYINSEMETTNIVIYNITNEYKRMGDDSSSCTTLSNLRGELDAMKRIREFIERIN